MRDQRHRKTVAKHQVKRLLLRALAVTQRLGRAQSVVLTFDDGPHPDVTPGVLARLRAYKARAVFFVVGSRIPLAPQVLTQIVADGHRVGNHTYAHAVPRALGLVRYVRDVHQCQTLIASVTGQTPTLFRPSLGTLTPASIVAPKLLRLHTCLWSVDAADWRLRTREEALACGQHLAETIRAGDIVLLHDDNPCVLTVLDVVLPALAATGYDLEEGVHTLGRVST